MRPAAASRPGGTDGDKRKGGDYFGAAAQARAGERLVSGRAPVDGGVRRAPEAGGAAAPAGAAPAGAASGGAAASGAASAGGAEASGGLDGAVRAIRRLRALQSGDRDIWRREAEQALDEARAVSQSSGGDQEREFHGWFT